MSEFDAFHIDLDQVSIIFINFLLFVCDIEKGSSKPEQPGKRVIRWKSSSAFCRSSITAISADGRTVRAKQRIHSCDVKVAIEEKN